MVWGIDHAMHSPAFIVRAIRVEPTVPSTLPRSPLSPGEVKALAQVEIGKDHLFKMDLDGVEQRILANPWVQRVSIHKEFPHTLVIQVAFYEPIAFVPTPQGELRYLSSDGEVFGAFDSKIRSNLPVVSMEANGERKDLIMRVLKHWEPFLRESQIEVASIAWDSVTGLQTWLTYGSLGGAKSGIDRNPSRVQLVLGQIIDDQMGLVFPRVRSILQYLRKNKIQGKQIRVYSEKNIVVKTARGS